MRWPQELALEEASKKMTKILQAKPTHRTTYTKDFYSCQKTFGVFIFESTDDA